MELINRVSVRGEKTAEIYLEENRLRFNTAAVVKCKLKRGMYVHFYNDAEVWTFIANEDADGFLLTQFDKRKEALQIGSSALCKMMMKSFKSKYKIHLKVTPTSNEHFKISL